MRISRFQHAEDRYPDQLEITWDQFVGSIGPHQYVPVASYDEYTIKVAKEACPCFSPAEYPEGTQARARDAVERVWMFVADLDHVPEEPARALLERLRTSGLAHMVYSSFRHGLDPWRFRVVMPLTRPVLREEWGDFWSKMNAVFEGRCDPKCKDPSRIYFGVFAPAGTEAHNFYYHLPGDALDTDVILGAARADRDPERAEAIRRLGEAWPAEGRHDAHMALAGGLLLSGVTDSEAVDVLCAVAAAQDPHNEDRYKREQTVAHTREWINKGERVTSWTTLGKHVGDDVAMYAKAVLEAPPRLTMSELELFAKTLARKRSDDESVQVGQALLKICEGEIYGEVANRAQLTSKIAQAIGERFPKHAAKSIVELFIPALNKIGLTSSVCPSFDELEAMIERRQEESTRRDRDRLVAEMDQNAARIREAFKNGRSHPYDPHELQAFGDISRRWIIQHDRQFYLYFAGSYTGPYVEAAAQNAMARDLSPAQSASVQLYNLTDTGKQFKTLKQLVDEYGTVAEKVRLDLTAQKTTYDEKARCIIEAPCPLRPIQPVYHADVEQWLNILAGPELINDLKTWIAMVTNLKEICVALFLTGRASVGKSMMALGLSRLWTTSGPTPLDAAFEDFNDSILGCPLTFADEALPKDYRGNTKNAQLRLHIQQRERTVRRKFMANAKLLGATRTIVAAHDIKVLESPDATSENEIAATSERYFRIPTNPEAANYLAHYVNTFAPGRGWVDDDIIAQHALWIRDNHQHQSQGRFYIRRIDEEVMRMLTTGTGVKSAVCQWLVSYLLDPKRFHASGYSNLLVRVHQGQLFVNARGILAGWDLYVGKNERCPSTGVLTKALNDLCLDGERPQFYDKQHNRTHYRIVNTANLYAWAKNNGFASNEQIFEGLGRETVAG